jgi:hypothetical protein
MTESGGPRRPSRSATGNKKKSDNYTNANQTECEEASQPLDGGLASSFSGGLDRFRAVPDGCGPGGCAPATRRASATGRGGRSLSGSIGALQLGDVQFNIDVEQYVVTPAAKGYSYMMPEAGRQGVNNFFRNIGVIPRFANNLFHLQVYSATNELARFGNQQHARCGRVLRRCRQLIRDEAA